MAKRRKGKLAQAIWDHYAIRPQLDDDLLTTHATFEEYDEAKFDWLEDLEHIIAEHFPHAAAQFENSPCNCENSRCEAPHGEDRCGFVGTVPCQYVGQICASCAEYMPAQYLRGA